MRDCIDRVIQTPKTGRKLYLDLQNSEKTYIGTAVEIDLRSTLKLERGDKMDLRIVGHDVDVKFSQGKNWMIPPEAHGRPCILISANDQTSRYSLGIVVAHAEYLNPGANRDGKKSISREGRANIWWIEWLQRYPPNFWVHVPRATAERISEPNSGNQRMILLFRELLDTPISRKVVEDVAQQLDPTRRIRADKKRGTRNVLENEGILVLSGTKKDHRTLVQRLGLPQISRTEYLAHRFITEDERAIASEYGLIP